MMKANQQQAGYGRKKTQRKKEEEVTTIIHNSYAYTIPQQSIYCHLKLICIDCGKKLSLMGACCSDDKEYQMATKFYCHTCLVEHFGRPKRVEKWDNTPCLACGETLLNERMWNDIPERGKICPHNDDKIWQMTLAKIKGVLPEEIRTVKNNSPEPIELDWDPEPVINLLDPEQFHKHYRELALTRKKQEQ
ncbi:hypothetical protein G9A89_006847 [Geosiphon pyriformis]|nr:hypothetical protein G9A89_006847 [Geosiphon pyriformis]